MNTLFGNLYDPYAGPAELGGQMLTKILVLLKVKVVLSNTLPSAGARSQIFKANGPAVSFSSCQWNLIKTFQIKALVALITKMALIFS